MLTRFFARFPGSFCVNLLVAVLGLVSAFLATPIIGVPIFLFSVLAALLSLRDSRRAYQEIERLRHAIYDVDSRTDEGRILSNLRRPRVSGLGSGVRGGIGWPP